MTVRSPMSKLIRPRQEIRLLFPIPIVSIDHLSVSVDHREIGAAKFTRHFCSDIDFLYATGIEQVQGQLEQFGALPEKMVASPERQLPVAYYVDLGRVTFQLRENPD